MINRSLRIARFSAATAVSLVVVVYVIRVWSDFMVKMWKVGWHGEPSTFFSSDAVIFVVLSAFAVIVLAPRGTSRGESLVRSVVLMLGVGGAVSVVLGVLVGAFGLLEHR